MSTRTVSIDATGIGNIPEYFETNENNITKMVISGQTFELWRLCHADDYISWEEHVLSDDFTIISDILIEMFPETEFAINSYCHDGYGSSVKCGIFNGEYKEWELKHYSVFDDIDFDELEEEFNSAE